MNWNANSKVGLDTIEPFTLFNQQIQYKDYKCLNLNSLCDIRQDKCCPHTSCKMMTNDISVCVYDSSNKSCNTLNKEIKSSSTFISK